MQKPDRPYWPAMMKRQTAAAYLDVSEAGFMREVFEGRLPESTILGGRPLWVRKHIDEAIDRLTEEVQPDWRTTAPLYASESRRQARPTKNK